MIESTYITSNETKNHNFKNLWYTINGVPAVKGDFSGSVKIKTVSGWYTRRTSGINARYFIEFRLYMVPT